MKSNPKRYRCPIPSPQLPSTSYSQEDCKDDLWVLKTLNYKRKGYFVELGAYDGVNMSNTLLLEQQYAWRGLCIEPLPELYLKLIKARSCSCTPSCVYHANDLEVPFALTTVTGHEGIFNHVSSTPDFNPDLTSVPVLRLRTRTLESLFIEYKTPKVIDYMSLDTEGSEYEILRVFPFNKYFFRTLTVEGDKCNDLLLSKGYQLVPNPFETVHRDRCFVYPNLI